MTLSRIDLQLLRPGVRVRTCFPRELGPHWVPDPSGSHHYVDFTTQRLLDKDLLGNEYEVDSVLLESIHGFLASYPRNLHRIYHDAIAEITWDPYVAAVLQEELATLDPAPPVCDCGKEKSGALRHYDWCSLGVKS